MTWEIRQGDVLDRLRAMPDGSVHCCVTSPPYWGLRDYGCDGQIGLEATVDEWVAQMVAVFREVRRVLRDDGVFWLNLGDAYAGSNGAQSRGADYPASSSLEGGSMLRARQIAAHPQGLSGTGSLKRTPGLKPKDLIGMPWRVAFALQADGWYLRSDVVWSKPNPMPESVTDRPTKAHEYVFLLTKSARYFYDSEAIREDATAAPRKCGANSRANVAHKQDGHGRRHAGFNERYDFENPPAGRNARTVWTIATQPYPEAHFATFPEALAEKCILAGSPSDGTVLDPFAGSGTTGAVCVRYGRAFIGIELNPEYVTLTEKRIKAAERKHGTPLFDAEAAR